MTDEVTGDALLRCAGAVGIGAGALALFPSVAAAVPLTNVLVYQGSRPAGVAIIHQLGDRTSFTDEDPPTVATRDTARYEAAVWLPTPADEPGDEDDWAWHGRLAGAYLATDAGRRRVTLLAEDAVAPRATPCVAVKVLMRVDDPATGGAMITWWHDGGAGQARYTAGAAGSTSDTVFTRLRLPDLHIAVRAVTPCDTAPTHDHRETVSSEELDPR